MKKVKLHLNHAGYCHSKESHVIKGGRKKDIEFHALWGLIKHPQKGWILYDTGYAERFYDATKNYPNKIYAKITKVFISKDQEIQFQLKENNISPLEIKHIILTHLHADHIGGLKDFPNANIYLSRDALEQFNKIPDVLAFSKAILKDLIPKDFIERTIVIEDKCNVVKENILNSTYDLFGDNSIQIVPIPGHAAGQVGVIVETDRNKYFLVSDACWLKKSYEDYALPNQIVRLFFDSWNDYKKTLFMIHKYHKANPKTNIVPTHCYTTTSALISNKITLDVL